MGLRLTEAGACFAHVVRVPGGRPRVLEAACVSREALHKHAAASGWKQQSLSLVLGRDDYRLLATEAPDNIPPEEMANALRWRIKDMVDFPVDQATLDVLQIPVPDARAHHVFVAIAPNDTLLRQQLDFRDANMPLSAIDIPELAQRNISALLEEPGRGVAMLVFGRDYGVLTVSYKGELYLARRIDVGLEQLEHPDPERREAFYERVALELQRSQDGFERQFSFISVAKLWLGPLQQAEALQQYLAAQLYIQVGVLDLAQLLDFADPSVLADARYRLELLHALGGALRAEVAA